MRQKLIQFIISSIVMLPAFGQEASFTSSDSLSTLSITLNQAMNRARSVSVDAELARNHLRSAYWSYRSYKAQLLPEVILKGSLPSYHKQYSSYMNEEGNYSFVHNNYLQLSGEVSVKQNIWLTGGTVAVNTYLDFYRQLGMGAYNRFMSIPASITLTQPIFGVNNLKWNRRIEPVRYEEAKAEFMTASENVAVNAIRYYFALLMAKENMFIAQQNLENAEKLYQVAKEKREMGRISQNDLLQMELNLLNAKSDVINGKSELKNCMFKLRSFLDFDESVNLSTLIPTEIPEVEIKYENALDRALANNSFSKQMLRIQMEADYEVAKAKGEQREINLFAQLGFTGTAHNFGDAYRTLRPNQIVEIGFEIPIVDWGKRKGKVKVAESNRRLIESQVRQETQNFRQNLFILVERYGNQLHQLQTARRADEIAQKRYETNVETFLIGKISTLDLNDSRVKKDEARREYINELYLFWLYYYQIRSITLWDYASDCGIDSDIEQILN